MRKLAIAFISIIFIGLMSLPVQASSIGSNNISPYSTAYGNGGVSKIEIMGNRKTIWWSVKPATSHSYTFQGTVNIWFKDGTFTPYLVSRSGHGGQSVSDMVYVRKAVKKVSLSGIAWGAGGIQITLPNTESNDFSGGGTGMHNPDDVLVVTE